MNSHTIRSAKLQWLKERVRFAEIRKKVSELEDKRNMLETQHQKYQSVCAGLLKSASSVTPRSGTFNAESLLQRAIWIDTAYFLRTFSQANENRLRSEILDLVPSQEAASRELRYVEEHTMEIEKSIRAHTVRAMLVQEMLESTEAADIDTLKRHTVR